MTDVPESHWARRAVVEATGPLGLMAGMKDGTFQGTKPLSRLQFAYVLRTLVKVIESEAMTDVAAPTAMSHHFTDVSSDQALVDQLANQYGAFEGLSGIADGRFQPGKVVTRYEFARVLNNLLQHAELKGAFKPLQASTASQPFTDVSSDQHENVELAWRRYNYLSGFPDNTFRGDEGMNRYQFAAAMMKALERVKELKAEPVPQPIPTAIPTPEPVPTPEPTPMPTPTPRIYTLNNYELSATYGVLPQGTQGIGDPSISNALLGSSQGLFAIDLLAAQDIGSYWFLPEHGNWFISERARFLPTAPTTGGLSAMLGVGYGYRWKVAQNFHIVPSIGVDVWGASRDRATFTGVSSTVGYGLGFDWWPHSQFSVSLGAEGRHGWYNQSVGNNSTPAVGFLIPTVGFLYSGDFKIRYYPVEQFGIQLGAKAIGIPQVGTNSNTFDLMIGPNAGITWQF